MDYETVPKEIRHSQEEESYLKEFKQALGDFASGLSDNEIERIHYIFERFAGAAFDNWIQKRNSHLPDIDKTV